MAHIKTLPESTRLKITYRNTGDLTPYAGNARTHSDKQITQIAASIRQFGFTNPVLIDDNGGIVAGHGRVAAAKQLGIAEVPTIALCYLTPAERRAYVIADNRLAELAGWDREILKIEFQALADLDLDFDLEITGFETAELDLLLDEGVGDAVDDPADDVPAPEPGPAVTQPGDVWCLGKHRLICGDARDPATYAALMGTERARAVFTDP
ncbi:MAG: ParB/Srx family N-terminal domain-containing protein, partial [Pseudomonadota bacterium]